MKHERFKKTSALPSLCQLFFLRVYLLSPNPYEAILQLALYSSLPLSHNLPLFLYRAVSGAAGTIVCKAAVQAVPMK